MLRLVRCVVACCRWESYDPVQERSGSSPGTPAPPQGLECSLPSRADPLPGAAVLLSGLGSALCVRMFVCERVCARSTPQVP